MGGISTELARRLAERHRQYLASDDHRTDVIRPLARALGILPVTGDWERFLGLRVADGEVVAFTGPHDPVQPVREPEIRIPVLARARHKYPELAELVPARPVEAETCGFCEGTGHIRPELGRFDPCVCGGAGWWVGHQPPPG